MVKLRRPIVPIEKWVRDPYYLGKEAEALRPFWREKIVAFFRGTQRNILFTGSSRSGKSYAILIIIIRYIYEIWVHEDFPSLFGLSSTTLPKIIFFSFSDDKAKSVGISRLIRMIDQIPFFQHPDRKRRAISTMVAFPWVEVWPGTQIEHAIGDDVFAGVMDEANIRGVAKAREVAEAQELFMELRMRSETTYSLNGVWAGFSAIISTAGKSTSFTDMEVAKAERDGSRYLIRAAV
jgi:hypothetical protein